MRRARIPPFPKWDSEDLVGEQRLRALDIAVGASTLITQLFYFLPLLLCGAFLQRRLVHSYFLFT